MNHILNQIGSEFLFDCLNIEYFYYPLSDNIRFTGFNHEGLRLSGNINFDSSRINIVEIYKPTNFPKNRSYTREILEHLISKFSFEPESIKFVDVREKRLLEYLNDSKPDLMDLDSIGFDIISHIPFLRTFYDLNYTNVNIKGYKEDLQGLYKVKSLVGIKSTSF